VHSQLDHAAYGGVVPEVAARAHEALLFPVIDQALREAQLSLAEISAIAVTCGPGLIGGLMVGVVAGKMLALAHNKPFIAVNHLEGHCQVCSIHDDITFPYLLLLISGGHCQVLEVYDLGKYKLLGSTLDDSVGEMFDKVARLLGLPYPGGPNIERHAAAAAYSHAEQTSQQQECQAHQHFNLPPRFKVAIPLKGKPGCDFSFSGMKTAFRTLIDDASPLTDSDVNDIAASVQISAAEALVDRVKNAIAMASAEVRNNSTFVIAGGVAANRMIRQKLTEVGNNAGYNVFIPPIGLCTDNAVMIAWTGLSYYTRGVESDLRIDARSRWELSSMTSEG
jgi:N6-L-threonylcarbamoyladenine synthase